MTQILGISGSLRKASLNTSLLRAAAELAPDGVSVEVHDLRDVPLFNSDLDPKPDGVVQLENAIDGADAVLIATPEYNYSVSGVLKNAIDWASRPAYQSVFRNKPTGVMSAAMSIVGGARAQQHAKTIFLGMGTPVFAYPELLVPTAHQKFEDGSLADEKTREFLQKYLVAFSAWVTDPR